MNPRTKKLLDARDALDLPIVERDLVGWLHRLAPRSARSYASAMRILMWQKRKELC